MILDWAVVGLKMAHLLKITSAFKHLHHVHPPSLLKLG
jgi:hypothetical protein